MRPQIKQCIIHIVLVLLTLCLLCACAKQETSNIQWDGPALTDIVAYQTPKGYELYDSTLSGGAVLTQDVYNMRENAALHDQIHMVQIALEQYQDDVTPYSYMQKIDLSAKTIGDEVLRIRKELDINGETGYLCEQGGEHIILVQHGDAICSISWKNEHSYEEETLIRLAQAILWK